MATRHGDQLAGERLLAALAEAPARVATVVDGVSAAGLRTRPQPEEWSANEVLAHLRACADVWGECITTILADDMPTIRAVSPGTWIERTDYLDLQFQPSLRSFTEQRGELLRVLEGLTPDDWSRAATVTGAGRPLTRTVLSYAQRLATHERPHVKQIERAVRTLRARGG